MNCGFFEKKLADYVKGVLSSSLSREMEEHFSSCEECRKLFMTEKIISGCMRETATQNAPDNLEDRIMQRISSGDKSVLDLETISPPGFFYDCGEFETNAAAYIDGSLSPEIQRSMEKHLKDCTCCGKLLEAHRVVYSSLENTFPVKAPVNFETTILGIIYEESFVTIKPAFGVRYIFRFRIAAAFAAVVSLFAAIFVSSMLLINRLNEIIFALTGNQDTVAGFSDLLGFTKTILFSRVALILAEYSPDLVRSLTFDSSLPYYRFYLTVALGIMVFAIWNYIMVNLVSVKNVKKPTYHF